MIVLTKSLKILVAISVFLFLLTFLRLPLRTRYEHSSGDFVFSDWKPFWSIGAEDSIRFDILLLLWVGLLVVTVFLYLLLQGQSDSRHKALRADNHPLQATSSQTPKDLSAKLFWWGFIGLPTSVFVYTCISDPSGLEFSTGFILGLFAGTALPLAISGAILGLLIWLCVRRSIGKRTCVAGTTIAISAMLILGMYYRNPSPWAVTFILVSIAMCAVVLVREKEAKKLTNSLLQTTENRPFVEAGAMDVLVSTDTLRGDGAWEADNNLAEDVVFNCWNCEQEIIANRVLAGRSINCPNCSKTLSVPES